MWIEKLTPDIFQRELMENHEYIQILRAKGILDIYAANYDTEHIVIARSKGIARVNVASAAHISAIPSESELDYFRSGSSLGEDYVVIPTEEELTISLLLDIMRQAGYPAANVEIG